MQTTVEMWQQECGYYGAGYECISCTNLDSKNLIWNQSWIVKILTLDSDSDEDDATCTMEIEIVTNEFDFEIDI